jgi:hypothetical protein
MDGHMEIETPEGDVFGPNGAEVRAVLDRMRNATTIEVARLADRSGTLGSETWDRAERAAWDATWMSGRVSQHDLAVE